MREEFSMHMFDLEAKVQKQEILFTNVSMKCINVLMVEDNDISAQVIQAQLEQLGMKVTRAVDGKEAVELFRNSEVHTFDVILMDILMPGMNGYEATRAIRRLHDHADALTIPIIAMTANVFAGDERTSFDAGMNGYMVKPIATEDVANTIVRNIHQ